MVFGVALLLISAIMAAQYISVTTDATLTVETQDAAAQIAAHDPSVDGNSAHNYLLEYDGTGFTVNLGTWGEQNTFKSSMAFLLVNAGDSDVQVTGAQVTGLNQEINVWLQDGQMTRDNTTGTSQQIWAKSNADTAQILDPENEVLLVSTDTPYTGGYLRIQEDTNVIGTANWTDSGDGNNLWRYTEIDWTHEPHDGNPDGILNGFGTTSNAAWVYIEVDPDGTGALTGTLEIFIEDA